MALRIRNGHILCAAKHPPQPYDIYINDVLHEYLAENGILVTEPMYKGEHGGHDKHGEWWIKTIPPANNSVK